MPNQADGAVGAASVSQEEETLYPCDWSNCPKKQRVEINAKYPKGGKVTKGAYRDKWINADKQPWKLYGELKKRLMKNGKAYRRKTYEYKTQAHHLVPTTLLKKTTTLKSNLELISYDCDKNENGMMLPQFTIDIPLHGLQSHWGNHPGGYMTPIRDELRRIEKAYEGACKADEFGGLVPQSSLKDVIDNLSRKAETKILNIKTGRNFWPLRTGAREEYKDAYIEYSRRELLHANRGE